MFFKASEVLQDQTAVRLAERKERRTDWVMDQWGNTNARLGQLLDLLERQQLLRPRDVIMHWASKAPPPMTTFRLTSTVDKGGGRPLPRPGAPPLNLKSVLHQPPPVLSGSGVMRWSYEEVHAGTSGFSPSLKVGEGGFGVVYRATLRKRDCAVKRLKQDTLMDWALLKESFQTEVDKLSKFRHPNIVELLGFSEGGGAVFT
ncbi:hypothetical protein JOQ06_028108 [Pogonophryne albipinna]|uniref:Protein kinase domain-containing protein n=1 Tax=Pogonophryne albipinna TaxID=1090488 RepID=A0AAD6AEU4_9TELE|nr:hypothetical protein JOQ06_028108 [Pogonophryne albipinna]